MLIVGYIPPLSSGDHLPTNALRWCNGLRIVLEKATRDFWKVPEIQATFFFPYDPSIPIDPYPVATIIVESCPMASQREKRNGFAACLAKRIRIFLNRKRGAKDTKVEVIVRSPNLTRDGYYSTD